jgi:hypothetical protein
MTFDAFDLTRAETYRNNSRISIAPRTDVAETERCFVVLVSPRRSDDVDPRGFIQGFKDGSWGYWRELMEQAKPAPTRDEAIYRLLDLHPGGISTTESVAREMSKRPRRNDL